MNVPRRTRSQSPCVFGLGGDYQPVHANLRHTDEDTTRIGKVAAIVVMNKLRGFQSPRPVLKWQCCDDATTAERPRYPRVGLTDRAATVVN